APPTPPPNVPPARPPPTPRPPPRPPPPSPTPRPPPPPSPAISAPRSGPRKGLAPRPEPPRPSELRPGRLVAALAGCGRHETPGTCEVSRGRRRGFVTNSGLPSQLATTPSPSAAGRDGARTSVTPVRGRCHTSPKRRRRCRERHPSTDLLSVFGPRMKARKHAA